MGSSSEGSVRPEVIVCGMTFATLFLVLKNYNYEESDFIPRDDGGSSA